MLQVDALRLRLEEKESFLNKKTKQLQDLTEEKGTLAGEIRDMKDMLEVKERKINVLQKKVRMRIEANLSTDGTYEGMEGAKVGIRAEGNIYDVICYTKLCRVGGGMCRFTLDIICNLKWTMSGASCFCVLD